MSITSTRQKVGFVIAGLICVGNIASVLFPTPDGQDGPPLLILVLDALLGVVGLIAIVMAWRTGNRAAIRVASGAIIVAMVTGLPAFFVDIPIEIKAATGVFGLLTIAAVVLMLSPSRQPALATN
jgi:hypothetical protein